MSDSKKIIVCIMLVLTSLSASAAELAMPNAINLITLLKQGEYVELDKRLAFYHGEGVKDPATEKNLMQAYIAFEQTGHDLLPHLNTWIALRSRSSYAYLARGVYYMRLGLDARGGKFINETTETQIEGMVKEHAPAIVDIEQAVKLNPRLGLAYAYGLKIAAFSKAGTRTKDEWFTRGMLYQPNSFALYRFYLRYLQPKWNGSPEDIQAVLRTLRPKIEANTELKKLLGYPAYIKSEAFYDDKRYQQVVKLMTKAIGDYGSLPLYFYQRGLANYKLKKYSAAKQDMLYVQKQEPNSTAALRWLGNISRSSKEYEQALAYYDKALALDPNNSDLLERRAYLYRVMGDVDKSLADYDTAIIVSPDNGFYYNRRGWFYHAQKNYVAAINDFNQAIILRPGKAAYYANRGQAYMDSQQFKLAVNDYKKSLELKPDNTSWQIDYVWALYKSVDCQVVPEMDKYLAMCKKYGDCKQRAIDWTVNMQKTIKDAKSCA